jgi:hypothetical protein
MRKLICALGMVSLLSVGLSEEASAQYGYPTRQVSARAKGAIIGAGLGAAAGAIIHRRDPVAGGIVGAVIGAGGGYVIGNNEDKIRRQSGYGYNSGYQYRQRRYNNDGYYRQRRVYNNSYGY